MKRIIYCSRATSDVTPDDLVELLESCRANNRRDGLTGMLVYSGQSYLQVLEGHPNALVATYERILTDPRHSDLRMLTNVDVAAPMFPDWTMGFEHVDEDGLAADLPGFTPPTLYPLVDPALITNAGVATTLLKLYAKNRVR